MTTVVTKEPPSLCPCQFVAVWKYNGGWWSSTYQIKANGNLKEWRDTPGNSMVLKDVGWTQQPWHTGDATEAFFVYEEE